MGNIQFGGVVRPSNCGCTVEGVGTLPEPWRVVHCAEHGVVRQDLIVEVKMRIKQTTLDDASNIVNRLLRQYGEIIDYNISTDRTPRDGR